MRSRSALTFSDANLTITTSAYARLELPRYIWVVELSTYEGLVGDQSDPHASKDRKIVGEVLIDATGQMDDSSVIGYHLLGLLITNPNYDYYQPPKAAKEDIFVILRTVRDDCPYHVYTAQKR